MSNHKTFSLALIVGLAVLVLACDDDPKLPVDQSQELPDQSELPDEDLADQSELPCSATRPCSNPDEVCELESGQCVPKCSEQSCAALGLLCDPRTGRCAETLSCTESAHCPATQSCDRCRGFCIERDSKKICVDGSNCFSDQYCDPCTGLCEPRTAQCEACVFHHECGAEGQLCLDIPSSGGRFCTKTCSSVLDCDSGYDCVELGGSKQCVPASGDCSDPAECDTDFDCLGGNVICRNGLCAPGCTDGGCPDGQVCDDGRCLAPCPERVGDCPKGQNCNPVNGKCEYEGECATTRDCGVPEMYCDEATHRCTAGCQVDDDCWDAAKECKEGACVRRGCKGAYACAFQQICEMQDAVCVDAEGPYCEVCDPEEEGACGPEENKCIELQDKDGNSMGNFCFVACSTDPDNICPQGYQCAPLQDQDGNPAGEVCFRDCTVDPWGE
ncbi:MAG: hypothetical protein RBU37_20415 [Myxococcota bacterium]|nr:hypothetical protein [Myxococcota bacterium]